MDSNVSDLLVILVIMLGCLGIAWLLVTHIGRATADSHGNKRLAAENEALKDEMARLVERVGVLERIATDPATRTAREIEDLRGPGGGDAAGR